MSKMVGIVVAFSENEEPHVFGQLLRTPTFKSDILVLDSITKYISMSINVYLNYNFIYVDTHSIVELLRAAVLERIDLIGWLSPIQ